MIIAPYKCVYMDLTHAGQKYKRIFWAKR